MRRWLSLLAFCAAPLGAQAQTCGNSYTAVAGDTVFSIAQRVYGDAEKWTLLYYANEASLKASVFQVTPGDVLTIPCEPGSQTADATPLAQSNAELKLVTGSNFAPFSDTRWPGQGMATEIVNAALESMPDPVTYSIQWENDWSKHLFPMLDEKQVDMGFPWFQPDCTADPGNTQCANFHFSDPLVEVLILLFVREGDEFRFDRDEDLVGKTLCRPAGEFTHDLDRAGREWISKGLIRLEQPDTAAACFGQLLDGRVDAVSVNVFEGATSIDTLGLRGQVVPLDRPVSSEGLHVVISKRHWRGTTHLYRFNAGLQALRSSDRYAQIVSKHLGIFWDKIKAN